MNTEKNQAQYGIKEVMDDLDFFSTPEGQAQLTEDDKQRCSAIMAELGRVMQDVGDKSVENAGGIQEFLKALGSTVDVKKAIQQAMPDNAMSAGSAQLGQGSGSSTQTPLRKEEANAADQLYNAGYALGKLAVASGQSMDKIFETLHTEPGFASNTQTGFTFPKNTEERIPGTMTGYSPKTVQHNVDKELEAAIVERFAQMSAKGRVSAGLVLNAKVGRRTPYEVQAYCTTVLRAPDNAVSVKNGQCKITLTDEVIIALKEKLATVRKQDDRGIVGENASIIEHTRQENRAMPLNNKNRPAPRGFN